MFVNKIFVYIVLQELSCYCYNVMYTIILLINTIGLMKCKSFVPHYHRICNTFGRSTELQELPAAIYFLSSVRYQTVANMMVWSGWTKEEAASAESPTSSASAACQQPQPSSLSQPASQTSNQHRALVSATRFQLISIHTS